MCIDSILRKLLFCLLYAASSLVLAQGASAQDKYLSILSLTKESTAKQATTSSDHVVGNDLGKESNHYSAVLKQLRPAIDADVIIDLPDRSVVAKRLADAPSGAQVFSFVSDKGIMFVTDLGDAGQELRLHDAEQNRYFTGITNKTGALELVEQDINEFICVEYHQSTHYTAENSTKENQLTSVNTLTDTPSSLTVNELKSLQSRPGAVNVILVDYWGGVVTGTAWNDTPTEGTHIVGQPIPYDEFNVNGPRGGTDDFTANEKSIMYTGWASMAEDYAPFNVNVTTSLSIFNSTPVSQRARLIVTPTIEWYTPEQAGGVAYVGVFNQQTNYFKVGWSWAQDSSQIGQINSHEAGHIMGLSHDGYVNPPTQLEYYTGHGNWSSIMGGNSPFDVNGSLQGFRDYSHWNNGSYNFANNTADNDISDIASVLGVVADDVANSNITAQLLDIEGSSYLGLIHPQALGADTDVFRIQQAATSTVTLEVKPAFVDINSVQSAQNLSMRVQLTNESDQLIAQALPNEDPLLNRLSFNQTLTPGTYYLSIENESYNTSPATGFPEYGNGGFYSIDVSGGFNSTEPDLMVSSIQIQPGSLQPDSGELVSLDVTATNGGFDAVTQYTVSFYQSVDTVIDNTDSLLDSQVINESLVNGMISSTWQTSFVAPSETGRYYYGVCLSGAAPAELNPNNNCSQAVTLSVDDGFCLPLKASNGNVAVICL